MKMRDIREEMHVAVKNGPWVAHEGYVVWPRAVVSMGGEISPDPEGLFVGIVEQTFPNATWYPRAVFPGALVPWDEWEATERARTEQAREAQGLRDRQDSIYEKHRCADLLRAHDAFGSSVCDHASFSHDGGGGYRVELTMRQFQRILDAAEAARDLMKAAMLYGQNREGALREGDMS